jgi:hypothetical protein
MIQFAFSGLFLFDFVLVKGHAFLGFSFAIAIGGGVVVLLVIAVVVVAFGYAAAVDRFFHVGTTGRRRVLL